tara:strand:+ start:32 stop:364 length:333 start_codon:yes stop_codon:yes gene_type:complete
MNQFQNIVMGIAIISLISLFIIFGVMLYYAKSKEIYPPVIPNCPDYWLNQKRGKQELCYNHLNLGKDSCNKTINFNTEKWKGVDHICKKKQWALNCDLTWDGITNSSKQC